MGYDTIKTPNMSKDTKGKKAAFQLLCQKKKYKLCKQTKLSQRNLRESSNVLSGSDDGWNLLLCISGGLDGISSHIVARHHQK